MAGSEHEAGSAPVPKKRTRGRISPKRQPHYKKQGQKSNKEFHTGSTVPEKTFLITLLDIIFALILGLLIYFLFRLKIYAAEIGCKDTFLNAIYDCGLQLLGADSIISIFLSYPSFKMGDRKKCAAAIIKNFFRCTVIFLAILNVLVFIKIEADKAEKEEQQIEESLDNSLPSQDTQTKELDVYLIDQDLHMHEKSLENYYDGEITDKNRPAVMAEILYNNMEHNKPKGNISQNYNNFRDTAEGRYENYLSQRAYSKKKGDINETLFEDRMNALKASLGSLEDAEKECETPINEYQLATGYKDMGDEYVGRENQPDAIDAYELCQEWCMKSIYHAAAIGDYPQMNLSMELFKKLGTEVSKLKEVSNERKNKITLNIEAYDKFTSNVNQTLNSGH